MKFYVVVDEDISDLFADIEKNPNRLKEDIGELIRNSIFPVDRDVVEFGDELFIRSISENDLDIVCNDYHINKAAVYEINIKVNVKKHSSLNRQIKLTPH